MSVRGLIERRLVDLARRFAGERRVTGRRSIAETFREPRSPTGPAPEAHHADERTIRRMGEAELGGLSSEESREAYERGDNPGGMHSRARRARGEPQRG